MDNSPVLLVVGDFCEEHIDLAGLCSQFGWRLKQVSALDDPSLNENAAFAAGLIDSSHDGGSSLRLARRRFPAVPWVACTRFSSPTRWVDLDRSGAFYQLHRPLRSAEFLHALGFVDAVLAQQRRLEAELNASSNAA